MSKKIGEHYEYIIRQWAFNDAIQKNYKWRSIDKVLSDAKKIYGFYMPENGKVQNINSKKDTR